MKPSSLAGPRALLAAALIGSAGWRAGTAQVLVPPGASLDVEIPSAPLPVPIEGRLHLAYELHVTNFRTVDLRLSRIDVIGEGRNGALLATYAGDALRSRLARVGTRPDGSDTRVVPPGVRAVFFVWLQLGEGRPAPSELHHRVSFEVVAPTGSEPGVLEFGRVRVGGERPIVLDPPLRGGPWVAIYEPSLAAGHRRALFAIDGKARIPARFAIDWIRPGTDGQPPGEDRSPASGSQTYGAEVLAVADGEVVSVTDGVPEPTVPITLDNAAGNYVILDLGGARFAVYEHLQPGSIRVRLGDRVRSGQVLARVGASGSVSSGAHLHFHVADGNSSLGAEGLPFVFRSFEVLGAFDSLDAIGSGKPWAPRTAGTATTRRLEMPLKQSVIRF